jgi:hypothetical protein
MAPFHSHFHGTHTVRSQLLSLLDLLQEESLLLLGAGWETLGLGLVDGVPDGLLTGGGVGFGLDLLGALLPPLRAAQLPTELGIVAAAIVEIGGIACGQGGS